MAIPETKTLDYAYIGSGVFCREEPKNIQTKSLDYAYIGTGVFIGFYQVQIISSLPTFIY
jgi:hypothetical protein